MDHLIEDVLSGDHERKTSVIASIFNFHDSGPENIPELLYKLGHLLGNYESSSRGEALSFLKELFDGFPADAINEDCRDFIVVQTLHAFVDENCSIRDMKHALQLLDTVANRLHIKKLMSNEEDSMQNLGRKLPGIGDFEVQSLLLKLLCKVADYGDEKFWSSVWFNKEDIRKDFLKTVIVNNPTQCRKFLNTVNRSEEYEKVFSFVAQAVSSNSVQLKKPNSLGDIWIDLNFDSRSISFCCEKFNDNNHQTVCIQAQSVEKYSLTTLVAAQVQELCIMLNCPFSDFLQEDIPFLDTSNLLIIRFWKFLNVNNYLKKIFGLPFNEIDGTSDNHCNRKVSQSQYLRSSDPQRYAATKTDDRKISRSCEIISTSLPTDVERQALSRNVSNSSDVERQTLSRKVSNSSDVFSFSDLKASMATIKKQRKVSNSYDAIPYDSNEVPTETQRSTQRKMSCSSEIIPVNDNEERTLSAEKVLEQVQQSSSFHSIETLHSPENKKLKSVTDNNEIDRDHSQLRNSPHILIVKENGANESSKEFQEDYRQDADVHVVGDDELHPNSSATVRQANKPASPENSEIEKLSQSRDSVLSRSKTKNDSKDLQIDELVSKDSDMNRKVPSPPGTNRERRYAIKSFASSRKNARHPHLQAYHENPKSPVDVLVLSDKQSSAEEEPVQGDDLEPHPSPEYFRKESNLNEESRSGKMPKTASKKFFKSTQRRKKLFDADRSSPVHIRNLSENTSSNRYKSKRTSLPRKPVPEKVTSAHRDSSSESDFRPLNWKRSKKSERNKTVSNDSGFREQSSASKSWNSSRKTKIVPPISEDEPDENISHGDNLRAETPHSNVFSPSNNDQDNRLDPNGAKLSRTVSQPLEEETESVRRKKLDESLKIMKARSNSSSSGSAHRRLQRNSVKPKKVLKKLFISDTETDSSGLSWTKSKQVRLFQSPKKTFFKRKTVSSASKFKSPLRIQPKRNPPSSKIKSVKAKRNSSKKNTSERPPNSSPDPYSVFDEPEYTVESHKKPPSGARLSRLSTTPRRRLPSISEDGQSFDAVHNDLTLIPGDSVSERMETPPDSNLSASKKGKRVHKPHILKVTPQKSPTENDIAFNRSGRKRVESRRGSDDNFVDITSGPDEVFEEPPPSHQESTRLSRNSRVTNASVSESRLRQNSCVQNDSCLDESGKISPDRTIYASDIYDLQNIPVAEECSPPSKTSSNLRKENVRSFSEEMIDENEKVDQYLQSLSEASVIDGKEKPDSDSVEAKSIGDKSDSNQLENEVEEQNVDIDVINALDDPSITERASPIEILDDEESLNKEKELLRKSNSSKEILGKSTNISEKRKIGKKRKFEEKNENPNLGTVKNIGSSKCLAREHQTLKKSFDESKEQRNLRKEAKMKNMRELSDITSSKKRKYKDFVDLEEIEFLGKDHHQIEESIEREAEEISEMKESKTIKSRKDKQEKEIDSSTLVPNWRSIRNSLDIYESAALAMNPITKKRFKKYKTSTPKPGKDLMYLNQKHCSSLFSLQESLEKLSFKLFQTLKKFHKQFIMEMAFSRQTMVSYINILLQESECSETDLEYLYESIQERRKHITNSINKMMQMAKEYFEKEQKWNRKFGQLQAKVIGKYTVKVYEVEKLAIDSVMKRMLSDAQNKFNSLINDFKYY